MMLLRASKGSWRVLGYDKYYPFFSPGGYHLKIVLFKSIRNSKRCNKGNFTSKSNWNKIKLSGGWG